MKAESKLSNINDEVVFDQSQVREALRNAKHKFNREKECSRTGFCNWLQKKSNENFQLKDGSQRGLKQ